MLNSATYLILERCIIGILYGRIKEQHFLLSQSNNTVSQPRYGFSCFPGNRPHPFTSRRHTLLPWWSLKSHLWLLMVIWHLWTDPDVAIVTQNDAGTTEKIVEMILTPLYQWWRDNHQCSMTQLQREREREREGGKRVEPAQHEDLLLISVLTLPYLRLRVWREREPSLYTCWTSACGGRDLALREDKLMIACKHWTY